MKKLGWIVGVLAVLLVVFVGVVSMQPDTMHIERTVVIEASPADVWPFTGDYANHQAWSPWAELDPEQVVTYSDPTTGVGAWYSWKGNDDVGAGRQEFIEVVEGGKTVSNLHFMEPWESHAVVTIALLPTAEGTQVSWIMDAEQDFAGKLAGMMLDLDAQVGGDFDRGLDKLKGLVQADVAERRAAAEAKAQADAEAQADADAAPLEGTTP